MVGCHWQLNIFPSGMVMNSVTRHVYAIGHGCSSSCLALVATCHCIPLDADVAGKAVDVGRTGDAGRSMHWSRLTQLGLWASSWTAVAAHRMAQPPASMLYRCDTC